jgi:magnesium chelatase family protein
VAFSGIDVLDVEAQVTIISGLIVGKLMRQRPFRDPRHSASLAALVGGDLRGPPGEVSLPHLGVLFLGASAP